MRDFYLHNYDGSLFLILPLLQKKPIINYKSIIGDFITLECPMVFFTIGGNRLESDSLIQFRTY